MSTGRKYMMLMLAGMLSLLPAVAQERLTGLEENPLARPQPRTRVQYGPHNASGTLSLPFVDNFVPANPWPDVNLWTTNGAYVNTQYAINMPVAGVATLDALGANGRLHPWLAAATYSGGLAPADTLTSLPVDLSSAGNVVLSFFYQAGGLGDMPDLNDSLKLEFYSPTDGKWTTVWSASVDVTGNSIEEISLGDTLKHTVTSLNAEFVYAAVAVDSIQWLQSGFQFRFRNLVSLTVNIDVPGRANNADCWHLNFVYLNSARDITDTKLPDVGIAVPQGPLTINYTSIPAYHLEVPTARAGLFTDSVAITYRNLGWGIRNVTRRISIEPIYGSTAGLLTFSGGSENIYDDSTQTRVYEIPPYDYTLASGADEVAFKISSYLVIDAENTPLRNALRKNDTTTYIQRFSDYYAYDDGSAENGYGLFGYGTANGRVATEFRALRDDSLRGVYLYFNLAKDSANIRPVKLAVWNDNDGLPGTLIYSQEAVRPVLRDSLNAYVAYKFNKPVYINRGQRFYVGWIQTAEAFLNIGFDVNRPGRARNFYALDGFGNWYPSDYDGSLMIRPIFCRPGNFPGDFVPPPVPAAVATEDNYLLYPNPASDIVSIRNLTAEEQMLPTLRQQVEIYDLRGQLLHVYNTPDKEFPVGDLAVGIYIVRIIEDNIVKTSRKIIIAR